MVNFDRLSSNIHVDGAIAVFNFSPEFFINANGEEPESLRWQQLKDDYDFWKIPSGYSPKKTRAYYVKRSTGAPITEFPSVMGIPMTYGGANRARCRALSSDIVEEEPFLIVPSFGLLGRYGDRARSFEFWLNTEPYPRTLFANILPEIINRTDYTAISADSGVFIGGNGFLSEVTGTDSYQNPENPFCKTIRLASGNASIEYRSHRVTMFGDNEYKFSFAARRRNTVDAAGFSLSIDYIDSETGQKISGSTFTTALESNTNWNVYEFQCRISETAYVEDVVLTVHINGPLDISSLSMTNIGADVIETVVKKTKIVEFFSDYGNSVTISADANFLYVDGHGNSESYDIGEWARPLYIVCTDRGTTFDVYINAALAMSIRLKREIVTHSGNDIGEWVVFYLSPAFKYIDLSTIAIYPNILEQDIQKIHMLFSYGLHNADVDNGVLHTKSFVASGANTTFSSQIMFPQTIGWNYGVSDGIDIDKKLTLRKYDFPRIIGGSQDYSISRDHDIGLYGRNIFNFPLDSEGVIRLSDIGTIDYIFIKVVPIAESARIVRIFAQSLPVSFELEYLKEPTPDTGDDPNNKILRVLGKMFGNNPETTYEEYKSIYSSYVADPSYRIKDYSEMSQIFPPSINESLLDTESPFLVGLNVKLMREQSDTALMTLFNSPNIELHFDDSCTFSYIALTSIDAVDSTNTLDKMLKDGDSDLPTISAEYFIDAPEGPIRDFRLIGNSTYCLYAHDNIMDIASYGTWYVSLPLSSFATYINGVPDLDFIIYSDQYQSPALISSLSKDYMTYEEFDMYAKRYLIAENSDVGYATNLLEYGDVQEWATNNDISNEEMGMSVSTLPKRLARFADRPVTTFITLDSPSRWPIKKYSSTKIERASIRSFIDFDASSNSVLDTRWEIFDGHAIRIPKDLNLYRYNLGYAVHMRSLSQIGRQPSFRRADFFSIASGDSPANMIEIGGHKIIVADDEDMNIDRPFSTHLSTETFPSNFMTREHGFYPHSYSDEALNVPIYFPLSKSLNIKSISFYINWRAETFRDEVGTELVSSIEYVTDTRTRRKMQFGVHVPDMLKPWIGRPLVQWEDGTSVGTFASIYVDGKQYVDGLSTAGLIECSRWHLIHIVFNEPLITDVQCSDTVYFVHKNELAVINFLQSYDIIVSPSDLFSQKFGTANTYLLYGDMSISGNDAWIDNHLMTFDGSGCLNMMLSDEDAGILMLMASEQSGASSPDLELTVLIDDTDIIISQE